MQELPPVKRFAASWRVANNYFDRSVGLVAGAKMIILRQQKKQPIIITARSSSAEQDGSENEREKEKSQCCPRVKIQIR